MFLLGLGSVEGCAYMEDGNSGACDKRSTLRTLSRQKAGGLGPALLL